MLNSRSRRPNAVRLLAYTVIATVSAHAQNLVVNPGFEPDAAGWQGRGPAILQEYTPAFAGANSVQVIGRTATWNGIRQPMLGLLEPGKTYICTAWVRTDSVAPVQVRMSFQLNYESLPTTYPLVDSAQVGTDWTYLAGEITLEPAAELTALYFYFDGPPDGVDLFVDEASVEPLVFDAPENLLTNPGFEPDHSGWSGFGGVDLAMTTGRTGGNAALAPNRTETYQGPSQSLLGNLLPGETHFCSAWVKTDSPAGEPVRITMRTVEDDATDFIQIAAGTASDQGWTWLTGYFPFEPTGEVTDITFYIEGPAAGVSLTVDDVYFAPAYGLRRAAAHYPGVLIGAGGINNSDLGLDPVYDTTTAAHFHLVGPGNAHKFGPIHPAPNTYAWSAADRILDFGEAHGSSARGHVFVWHSQVADWVTNGGFNESELQAILFDHIATVGGRYDQRLIAWDVVNEAISDGGGALRSTIWYDQPGIGYAGNGDEYIAESFRQARLADPDADLIYNDYNIETVNTKSTAAYSMLSGFQADGVPVTGIGMQAHLVGTSFNYDSFRSNLQRFQDLGLDIHITEFDVRLQVDGNGNPSPADLDAQGDVFFHFLGTALAFPSVKVFQLWGVDDGNSWIPGFFPGFGAALAFDEDFDKKPAYWGLFNALANQAENLEVVMLSAGDSHADVQDTLLGAGEGRRLAAASDTGTITLNVSVPYPGNWNIKVGVLEETDAGRYELAVAPADGGGFEPVGVSFDTYNSTLAATAFDLGTHSFGDAGDHHFQFNCAGKRNASTGYNLTLDYIRLTPVSCAPALSALADQAIDTDEAMPTLRFTAEDDVAAGTLVVAATSSDQTLLPDGDIVISGNSPTYWINATPAPGHRGVVTITVHASDGALAGETSFTLAVSPLSEPTVGFTLQEGEPPSLLVSGNQGPDYTVQVSTTMTNWANAFTTNSPTMPFEWTDPDWGADSERHYRAVADP